MCSARCCSRSAEAIKNAEADRCDRLAEAVCSATGRFMNFCRAVIALHVSDMRQFNAIQRPLRVW